MSNWNRLEGKVFSEGYCCMHGYLKLCQARGESHAKMGEWMEVSRQTIWYNYGLLAKGARPCMGHGDCMLPIVKEIEDAKKEPPDGGLKAATKETD